jgi:hypothetical protein
MAGLLDVMDAAAAAGLSSPDRLVLIWYARRGMGRHGAIGDAWPSWADVQHGTGLSRARVGKSVRSLVGLGVLVQVGRRGRSTRVYRIDLTSLSQRPVDESTGLSQRPQESLTETRTGLSQRPGSTKVKQQLKLPPPNPPPGGGLDQSIRVALIQSAVGALTPSSPELNDRLRLRDDEAVKAVRCALQRSGLWPQGARLRDLADALPDVLTIVEDLPSHLHLVE